VAISNSIEAGQAVYTKRMLSLYDLWVLGISNSLFWHCPTSELRKVFVENATNNHLDVGVGTGYFLDKCLSNTDRRVALLDLNNNSLDAAALRIRRFNPEIYNENVLGSFDLRCTKFDSVSVNYLLHCLPGSMKEKCLAIENILPSLNPNGVVFGSTILGKGVKTGFLAKQLMRAYNKKGIFGNDQDSLEELVLFLKYNFKKVDVEIKGSVAIFVAKI